MYVRYRKLYAPELKTGDSVYVNRVGYRNGFDHYWNGSIHTTAYYSSFNNDRKYKILRSCGNRGFLLENDLYYPFWFVDKENTGREVLIRNLLYGSTFPIIYNTYSEPQIRVMYSVINSLRELLPKLTNEGSKIMAKKISFKNILEYFGDQETIFRVIDERTEILRKFFEEKSGSVELSPKAKKVKELCMGFGSVGAIGENLAKILSEILEEDITFKIVASVPFVFMSCVKIPQDRSNLYFMIFHAENGNARLLRSDGLAIIDAKLNKSVISPVSSKQLLEFVDSLYQEK